MDLILIFCASQCSIVALVFLAVFGSLFFERYKRDDVE